MIPVYVHLKNVWLTYKTSYQFRYSIICSSPTRPPYSGVSLHHLANNNSGFHCSISALYFYYLRPRQLFSISFFFPSHFREEIRASCRHSLRNFSCLSPGIAAITATPVPLLNTTVAPHYSHYIPIHPHYAPSSTKLITRSVYSSVH